MSFPEPGVSALRINDYSCGGGQFVFPEAGVNKVVNDYSQPTLVQQKRWQLWVLRFLLWVMRV